MPCREGESSHFWESLNFWPFFVDPGTGRKERKKGSEGKSPKSKWRHMPQSRPQLGGLGGYTWEESRWGPQWKELWMEVLGPGMSPCVRTWLVRGGGPGSSTVPPEIVEDFVPSLAWGGHLLPLRSARQSLVVAYGQAWNVIHGILAAAWLFTTHWRQDYYLLTWDLGHMTRCGEQDEVKVVVNKLNKYLLSCATEIVWSFLI